MTGTHLGHERGGIFMLAVRHAAVAARGCSNAEAAAATATATASAGVVAPPGVVVGSAESASRGCWCLIAPTKRADSSSHIASRVADSPSRLPLFRPSLPPRSFARSLAHVPRRSVFSRRKGVLHARRTRVPRESSRPTDRPSDNGCGSGVEGSTREATRRDATRASP